MRGAVVVAVLLVLAAACGGKDDGASNASTTEQPGVRASARASSDGSDGDITAGGDCADATDADGPADLEMQDFAFEPRCLEISLSQGLQVHNEGDNEHNLTVEELGLDVDVSSGDATDLEATRFLTGTYTFFCKYHRESNHMDGTLVVTNG